MDTDHAKEMMDAFYEAKRIRDQMPALPPGIVPSYNNTLDAIVHLRQSKGPVRVSDVADYQHLPRPGVTKRIREMEEKGLVLKTPDPKDGRVIHLSLTEKGERLYKTYVEDYFGKVTEKLSGISNEEADSMARIIHRAYEALQEDEEHGYE